jgi:hypothetical protein
MRHAAARVESKSPDGLTVLGRHGTYNEGYIDCDLRSPDFARCQDGALLGRTPLGGDGLGQSPGRAILTCYSPRQERYRAGSRRRVVGPCHGGKKLGCFSWLSPFRWRSPRLGRFLQSAWRIYERPRQNDCVRLTLGGRPSECQIKTPHRKGLTTEAGFCARYSARKKLAPRADTRLAEQARNRRDIRHSAS